MKNARMKDILRTVKKEKKRFLSILLITALGVTMLTGLRASCNDLRYSADALFDEQKLFDIQISSTLGLDEEDVEALRALDSITVVEGEYAKSVYTDVDGVHKEAKLRTMGEEINVPTVLEGTLPTAENEIAVTETYLLDSGKSVGDTLTFSETDIEEDEESIFPEGEYVITAMVLDSFDVNNREGSVSFRASASADYTFFVVGSAANTEIYTTVYVAVAGAQELMCYTDAYTQLIQDVKNEINVTLKESRQQDRYATVYGEAMAEYTDAYDEVMAEIADAQQEIDDGWAEVEDGWSQLEEGKRELESQEESANAQIADGLAQIESGYASLEEAKSQLEEAAEEIADGEEQLLAAGETLSQTREETLAQLDDGIAQLADGIAQVQEGLDTIEAQITLILAMAGEAYDQGMAGSAQAEESETEEAEETQTGQEDAYAELAAILQTLYAQQEELTLQLAQLESQRAALIAQREAVVAQFAEAEEEISTQEEILAAGKAEYASGLAQWVLGQETLDESLAELNQQAAEAEKQFKAAWEEIRDSEKTLAEAEQKLLDGQAELDDGLAEALAELAEAKAEIDDIEMTRWYIQDRNSLSGYSNVDSDATSIEGIGTFLPLIFFVVAILISLTAITRMVEEERGLIGTYKALGFTNREIRGKYLIFASGAAIAGGVVGDFCGFVILPKIIFTFFDVMYTIPEYLICFQLKSGLVGIALFLIGVLAAVFFAVRTELRQVPAALMRPLVPKVGTRIFLERIPAIWKRLSFLNKVTARNLFRYKKRLLMTVVGIMGCTGLLICGFAIKNTVTDLMPLQYENVNRYDILAVVQSTDNDKLLSYMEDEENIAQYLNLQVDSVSIRNADEDEQSVQIFVIPDDASISDFIKIADINGTETTLDEEGIFITRSLGAVLGLEAGDTVTIQDLSLNETQITVAMVTENYLGDMIYISQSCYEACFPTAYEPNAVLVKLTESCQADDPIAYAKSLGAKDGLLSTVSTDSLKEEFSQAFQLINLVVYVILVLAAALAFVVLFTLSTTNISERCRELATIKVLGFFDQEVHLYVNKETLILSVIGILLGLPLGRIFAGCMTWALKIPGLYFAVSVHTSTYVICAVTSFVFALVVNRITNRLLNAIDPVEALKSVE